MRIELLEAIRQQRGSHAPFSIATVIRVEGSASARTGSHAIFDAEGRNVHGWIGGGCAERFVADQSLEALKERRTRIVTADLDDEIFGLGIACGGRMDVFIEPCLPEEVIHLASAGGFRDEAEFLARGYGWRIDWTTDAPEIASRAELFLSMACAIAKARGREAKSLRELKDLPAKFEPKQIPRISEMLIVGRGRIAESLSALAIQLGWSVRVFGPSVDAKDFPQGVRCECLLESYDELRFTPGSAVVIASHHAEDPEFVRQALVAGAAYVGMVGSRKRALEVLDRLSLTDSEIRQPLFVPSGLDLDARGPDEIALSIVSEILTLSREAGSERK